MSDENLEIVRGSGNLYRDLGMPDAELRQLKALLAAEIIKTLDDRGMTVRQAGAHTKIAAADFSRIWGAKLDRFTVDRFMTILSRLDREVEVKVAVRPLPFQAAHG